MAHKSSYKLQFNSNGAVSQVIDQKFKSNSVHDQASHRKSGLNKVHQRMRCSHGMVSESKNETRIHIEWDGGSLLGMAHQTCATVHRQISNRKIT